MADNMNVVEEIVKNKKKTLTELNFSYRKLFKYFIEYKSKSKKLTK